MPLGKRIFVNHLGAAAVAISDLFCSSDRSPSLLSSSPEAGSPCGQSGGAGLRRRDSQESQELTPSKVLSHARPVPCQSGGR